MRNKSAVIISGQGFDVDQVDDFQNYMFYKKVAEVFEEKFGYEFPKTKEKIRLTHKNNEVSATLLLLSYLAKKNKLNKNNDIQYAAGYSVGQIMAMNFAEIISDDQLIDIIINRSYFLTKAALKSSSTILAVLGLDVVSINNLINDSRLINKCFIANDNSVGNTSVACDIGVKDHAEQLFVDAGAFKVVDLKTSAGWHSPFVYSAVDEFKNYLLNFSYDSPKCNLVDNVYLDQNWSSKNEIIFKLTEHIYKPVRWRETMELFNKESIHTIYEATNFDLVAKLSKFTSPKIKFVV